MQKTGGGPAIGDGLIHYFGAKSQGGNKELEFGRLREGSKRLAVDYKVLSSGYSIQAQTPWHLYPKQVRASRRLSFLY